jgi:hypothetical protein
LFAALLEHRAGALHEQLSQPLRSLPAKAEEGISHFFDNSIATGFAVAV